MTPAVASGEDEKTPFLSIIIPTLDEAHAISLTLASTQDTRHVERIVVDGGSTDKTIEVAQSWGARVILSHRGRARQMNAGAREANGDFLLFLHADTRLSPGFVEHVHRLLNQPDVAAGAFKLQIDGRSVGLRLIEKIANWRSTKLRLPYGDQAIFLRASTFRALGGFPDLPILEDFELVRRLRKIGRIAIAPTPVVTSSRRWQKLGLLRTTLINQFVVMAFFLGVSPRRLFRLYHRDGGCEPVQHGLTGGGGED